ncbi:MAG: hypothetical protein ACYC91_12515 [Solirubrobacteraceae bacterium]
MKAALSAADEIPGGLQLTVTQTFEREGGEKPSASPSRSPASTRDELGAGMTGRGYHPERA